MKDSSEELPIKINFVELYFRSTRASMIFVEDKQFEIKSTCRLFEKEPAKLIIKLGLIFFINFLTS